LVFPTLVLARVRQTRGDLAGAHAALQQAKVLAQTYQSARYLPLLDAYEAQLWVTQGQLSLAQAWAEQAASRPARPRLDLHPFAFVYSYEHLDVAPIQVLIACGRLGEPAALQRARVVAERRCAEAEHAGLTWLRLKALTLQALADGALGAAERACATLAQALTLAAPEGYIRLFADEGVPLAELLRRTLVPGLPRAYNAAIWHALDRRST
jgi:LuxR family maltose regulon positive regulatory protein